METIDTKEHAIHIAPSLTYDRYNQLGYPVSGTVKCAQGSNHRSLRFICIDISTGKLLPYSMIEYDHI